MKKNNRQSWPALTFIPLTTADLKTKNPFSFTSPGCNMHEWCKKERWQQLKAKTSEEKRNLEAGFNWLLLHTSLKIKHICFYVQYLNTLWWKEETISSLTHQSHYWPLHLSTYYLIAYCNFAQTVADSGAIPIGFYTCKNEFTNWLVVRIWCLSLFYMAVNWISLAVDWMTSKTFEDVPLDGERL